MGEEQEEPRLTILKMPATLHQLERERKKRRVSDKEKERGRRGRKEYERRWCDEGKDGRRLEGHYVVCRVSGRSLQEQNYIYTGAWKSIRGNHRTDKEEEGN